MSIKRPDVVYTDGDHRYTLGGEEMLGVSTVAKIGEDEVWGIASAWAWRIGYEGAVEVFNKNAEWFPYAPDEMREELKKRGLTPWSKRDKAAERGTWVHDILEALAQTGQAPTLTDFPEEVRGYVRGVLRWYLDYRPSFVATEVQVASETYGFAGRYDIRCEINAPKVSCVNGSECRDCDCKNKAVRCLVDLKTGKGVYPCSHFPQLAGYELASVEMGFPKTAAQYVLNVKEDGTYEFKRSWAGPVHFLAYLSAARAIRDIKAKDPEEIRKREIEGTILLDLQVPQTARQLAENYPVWDLNAKGVALLLSGLRKRGLVEQPRKGGPWSLVEAQP